MKLFTFTENALKTQRIFIKVWYNIYIYVYIYERGIERLRSPDFLGDLQTFQLDFPEKQQERSDNTGVHSASGPPHTGTLTILEDCVAISM